MPFLCRRHLAGNKSYLAQLLDETFVPLTTCVFSSLNVLHDIECCLLWVDSIHLCPCRYFHVLNLGDGGLGMCLDEIQLFGIGGSSVFPESCVLLPGSSAHDLFRVTFFWSLFDPYSDLWLFSFSSITWSKWHFFRHAFGCLKPPCDAPVVWKCGSHSHTARGIVAIPGPFRDSTPAQHSCRGVPTCPRRSSLLIVRPI